MKTAPDVLVEIIERRRERVARGRLAWADESRGAGAAPLPPDRNRFLAALAARRGRAVVAEVKMGSPRLGSLAGRVDPLRQARLYAAHGAAALSVVVEPDFFGGSYEVLAECRRASGLPAIAKDFLVDPVQLRWAKDAGADAVLLIAALLSAEGLRRYAALARGLGLVPLVETHDADDAAKLAGAEWELVGVNHRDLRTFQVDLGRTTELVPRLPPDAVKVAESGIATRDDLARLRAAGFDAFLIGESLLLAPDPGALLEELVR
jgi:indole-3-glycerol phosphate synthase